MRSFLLTSLVVIFVFMGTVRAEESLTWKEFKKLAHREKSPSLRLEYRYNPTFFRHFYLRFQTSQGKFRMDSKWEGPRGKRHDMASLIPPRGAYQGEYYRDAFSLAFYEPLPGGRELLLAATEDVELFAGAFLIWHFDPLAMARLLDEKSRQIQRGSIKGQWGKNLQWEVQYDKNFTTLKKVTLRHKKTGAYSTHTIEEFKERKKGLSLPQKIVFELKSEGGKAKKTLLELKGQKSYISTLDPREVSTMTVVDMKLKEKEDYIKKLEKNPRQPRLWYSLAKVHLQEKEAFLAMKAFRQAIKYKPRAGMPYVDLLALEARLGRYGKITQLIRRARQNNVFQSYKLYFIAARYVAQKNPSFQEKLINRGLKSNPHSYQGIKAYAAISPPLKVLKVATKALRRRPDHEGLQKILEKAIKEIKWRHQSKNMIKNTCQDLDYLAQNSSSKKKYARLKALVSSK